MKDQSPRPLVPAQPGEDDIRDYAYHLYRQSDCAPGHDLANWFEATACLQANIPADRSGTRLHEHLNGPESGEMNALVAGAGTLVA